MAEEQIIHTGVQQTAMGITTMCMFRPHLCLPFDRQERQGPFVVFAHSAAVCLPVELRPIEKSHLLDKWTGVIREGAKKADISFLSYTARGYGESYGWEQGDAKKQFSWETMGTDMTLMANSQGIDKFIAGGSSMGAAAALWCALQHPERVLGLVLIRLPSAWEKRESQREQLLAMARTAKEQSKPNELQWMALEGYAYADLPNKDAWELYKSITCPILIVSIYGDPTHPASTGNQLKSILPHATVIESGHEAEALVDLPDRINNWVADVHRAAKQEADKKKRPGRPSDFLPFGH
jgi:hypothetical protein